MRWRLAIPILTALLAPPAYASDEEAKQLYEEGAAFYEEGRYDEAIDRWWSSWELSGHPDLLYNLVGAYERLGDWEAALGVLIRYRSLAPEDEWAVLDRRIENIERRIDEQPAASAGVEETGGGAAETSGSVGTIEAPSSDGPALAPIALYGIGGAGLIGGTVFALQARGARAEAASLCVADNGVCPTEAESLLRADRRSSILADVGFALGVAGVAGGVAFTVMSDDGAQIGWTRSF